MNIFKKIKKWILDSYEQPLVLKDEVKIKDTSI